MSGGTGVHSDDHLRWLQKVVQQQQQPLDPGRVGFAEPFHQHPLQEAPKEVHTEEEKETEWSQMRVEEDPSGSSHQPETPASDEPKSSPVQPSLQTLTEDCKLQLITEALSKTDVFHWMLPQKESEANYLMVAQQLMQDAYHSPKYHSSYVWLAYYAGRIKAAAMIIPETTQYIDTIIHGQINRDFEEKEVDFRLRVATTDIAQRLNYPFYNEMAQRLHPGRFTDQNPYLEPEKQPDPSSVARVLAAYRSADERSSGYSGERMPKEPNKSQASLKDAQPGGEIRRGMMIRDLYDCGIVGRISFPLQFDNTTVPPKKTLNAFAASFVPQARKAHSKSQRLDPNLTPETTLPNPMSEMPEVVKMSASAKRRLRRSKILA